MTNRFLTSGALAAVAAALAFTAVPASAQDWHHNRDNNSAQSNGNDLHADKRNNAQAPAWGSRNRGDQPQRTNTPAATQSNGQWTGRHADQRTQAAPQGANNPANNPWRAWNGNRTAPVEQNRANTYQGRNPTYVDPNRNTTYRDNNRNWQNDRRENNRNWQNDRRDNNQTWNGRDNRQQWDRNGRSYNQQWSRNWRNNNRYDWQRYRTYNRNAYHLSPYYAPYRDYSYRRLGVGFYLDPLFFGQDYLIGDPGYYRLPDVYGPYRWVRYYDDAVLVDVYSGEVVDVIYDFFW